MTVKDEDPETRITQACATPLTNSESAPHLERERPRDELMPMVARNPTSGLNTETCMSTMNTVDWYVSTMQQ